MESKSFSAFGEVVHDPLAIALLEVVLPLIGVFRTFGQHRIDQASQLVGGGGDGLGPVKPSAQTTEVSTQRRLTAT